MPTLVAAAGDPDTVSLRLTPTGDALSATLGGELPEGSPTLRIYRRVDDPTLYAGYALADVFRDIGVAVTGSVAELPDGAARGPLLSAHHSQPLAILLHALGKHSDNFYAEMIFKGLSPAPASHRAAADEVAKRLTDAGLEGIR